MLCTFVIFVSNIVFLSACTHNNLRDVMYARPRPACCLRYCTSLVTLLVSIQSSFLILFEKI